MTNKILSNNLIKFPGLLYYKNITVGKDISKIDLRNMPLKSLRDITVTKGRLYYHSTLRSGAIDLLDLEFTSEGFPDKEFNIIITKTDKESYDFSLSLDDKIFLWFTADIRYTENKDQGPLCPDIYVYSYELRLKGSVIEHYMALINKLMEEINNYEPLQSVLLDNRNRYNLLEKDILDLSNHLIKGLDTKMSKTIEPANMVDIAFDDYKYRDYRYFTDGDKCNKISHFIFKNLKLDDNLIELYVERFYRFDDIISNNRISSEGYVFKLRATKRLGTVYQYYPFEVEITNDYDNTKIIMNNAKDIARVNDMRKLLDEYRSELYTGFDAYKFIKPNLEGDGIKI